MWVLYLALILTVFQLVSKEIAEIKKLLTPTIALNACSSHLFQMLQSEKRSLCFLHETMIQITSSISASMTDRERA